MSENHGAIYWHDKPLDPEFSDGTMLTGVQIIRKPEAVDIMNKQHETITKQAEHIKMLRDALDSMVKMVDEDLLSDCDSMHAEMVFGSAEKALEATKPVEE